MKPLVHTVTPELFHDCLFQFVTGIDAHLVNPLENIENTVNHCVELFFTRNPHLQGKVYPVYTLLLANGKRFMVLDGKYTFLEYMRHLKSVSRISLSLIKPHDEVINFNFHELLQPKTQAMKPELQQLQGKLIDQLAEIAYMNVTESITPETEMQDIDIDSLQTVEVIMELEKQMSIRINDNDFTSDIKRMKVKQFAQWIHNRIITN